MSGKAYQRGVAWWITYRAHGKEVRLSVASALGLSPADVTERQAKRLLQDKLAELAQGRHLTPSEMRVTVDELLDQYLADLQLRGRPSLGKAERIARTVREAFGPWRAMHVRTPALREYVQRRLTAGLAPATVLGEVGVLRAAFRLAHRESRFNAVPHFPSLELDNARQGFVEPEQADRIYPELAQPYRDAAQFSYVAARRINEVLKLPWAQVDRTAREIRWPKLKNGQRLTLPLTGVLGEIIERRWQDRAIGLWLSPWVFHRSQRTALSYSAYRINFVQAVQAAGVPLVRPHDFRRSGIRNMVRSGVDRDVAKSISGHVSDSVFSRYNITSTEDQQQAFRQVEVYSRTRTTARTRADSRAAAGAGPSGNYDVPQQVNL